MGEPRELSDAELHAEWEAGMRIDSESGLNRWQAARLRAIETEMERREGDRDVG